MDDDGAAIGLPRAVAGRSREGPLQLRTDGASRLPSRIAAATRSMSAESDRSSRTRSDSVRTNVAGGANARPRLERREELDRLRTREQLDRQHPLGVRDDLERLEAGGVAHRDVILLAGARGDRVDRRGWLSALFSETSAAATYCGIMNPELRPSSRATRNGGRPSERLGLTIRSVRRSLMFASSAQAIARQSSPIAIGCPWKFPLETISCSSSRTSGLSVAAFSSTATVRSTWSSRSRLAPCT